MTVRPLDVCNKAPLEELSPGRTVPWTNYPLGEPSPGWTVPWMNRPLDELSPWRTVPLTNHPLDEPSPGQTSPGRTISWMNRPLYETSPRSTVPWTNRLHDDMSPLIFDYTSLLILWQHVPKFGDGQPGPIFKTLVHLLWQNIPNAMQKFLVLTIIYLTITIYITDQIFALTRHPWGQLF
jgi:hypothetical protein